MFNTGSNAGLLKQLQCINYLKIEYDCSVANRLINNTIVHRFVVQVWSQLGCGNVNRAWLTKLFENFYGS